MGNRNTFARRILGNDLYKRVQDCRVLCVGAGGIGCELLKNLVMTGFVNVEIIDLDTIDLSNLNRQFLFQKQHVKRSKSEVAKETASSFNPKSKINAIHGNIKDAQFDVNYFKSFDIVMNALDNLDARRHVNKMCLAANVPLIESGTAGYQGQVQPIKKGFSECYDCSPKELPKTYPVCTIRSTPSTPIHCIVWAKSYLFPQLFGPDEDTDTAELDAAVERGENMEEIENLRKEANAIKDLRKTLTESDAPQRVFDKIFKSDVQRLLQMEDMWKKRRPPVPLSYTELSSSQQEKGTHQNGDTIGEANGSGSVNGEQGLRDQRKLSLLDSFNLFTASLQNLSKRISQGPPGMTLDWDKDDDDALDFATASANLRAHIFGIPNKTRWEVKEMAGNIIPAIATTNAIIAGAIVTESLNILRGTWDKSRLAWLSRSKSKWIHPQILAKPNPQCAVCTIPYIDISLNLQDEKHTLSELIDTIKPKIGYQEECSVEKDAQLIYDPDFDDNLQKPLSKLGIDYGSLLTIADDEDKLASVVLIITKLKSNEDKASSSGILIGSIPPIPTKPVAQKPAATQNGQGQESQEKGHEQGQISTGKKRTAEEADLEPDFDQEKEAKKIRVNDQGHLVLDDDDDDDDEFIEI